MSAPALVNKWEIPDGPQITTATSSDSRFPASNIIDGNDSTFWLTTGMYPQEFLLDMKEKKKLSQVKLVTRYARKISVYSCDREHPTQFDLLFDEDVSKSEGTVMHTSTHNATGAKARYIKVVIESGYHPFAAVYELQS